MDTNSASLFSKHCTEWSQNIHNGAWLHGSIIRGPISASLEHPEWSDHAAYVLERRRKCVWHHRIVDLESTTCQRQSNFWDDQKQTGYNSVLLVLCLKQGKGHSRRTGTLRRYINSPNHHQHSSSFIHHHHHHHRHRHPHQQCYHVTWSTDPSLLLGHISKSAAMAMVKELKDTHKREGATKWYTPEKVRGGVHTRVRVIQRRKH